MKYQEYNSIHITNIHTLTVRYGRARRGWESISKKKRTGTRTGTQGNVQRQGQKREKDVKRNYNKEY